MSETWTGWRGRVLHIDLERGAHWIEEPPREAYLRWIGGRGMAGTRFQGLGTRSWDDPAMPLVVFAGPLVGTVAPTPGRCTVMSRSPLTGLFSDSSAGGRLGVELKRAGWDGVVITGRSETLCGVEIEDSAVWIRDASDLAGLDTYTVFDRLQGKGSVAAVGPAAEHGVRFACIVVDRHHAAGRTGLGRSMAVKNLKYLRVRGAGRVPVEDRKGLMAARENILRLTAASPVLQGPLGFSCFGTGALFDLTAGRRMMPTDNFARTWFEGAGDVNAHAFHKAYRPLRHACWGCHIACKQVARDGRSMPEFETLSHFTALIGNRDRALVMEANDLCNRYGMDTISAAVTLACHREITGEDLTPEQVRDLLGKTAFGIGVGRELAEGSKRYAARMGRPDLSMSVKALELPAYDPRGAYGMALAYAVASRGGCHLRAYPISHEILRKPVATDRFSFSGKARMIKIAEDVNAVVDSLIACKFTFLAAGLEEYAQAFAAVTGEPLSPHDLMRVGERICYQERILNAPAGCSRQGDDLPPRFFREGGTSGEGMRIPPLDRADFLETRARYYRIRGLDENGLPVKEAAERLGIPWSG